MLSQGKLLANNFINRLNRSIAEVISNFGIFGCRRFHLAVPSLRRKLNVLKLFFWWLTRTMAM
jgi:hypothetical protein